MSKDKIKVFILQEEHRKDLEESLQQMDSGMVTSQEEIIRKLRGDLGS